MTSARGLNTVCEARPQGLRSPCDFAGVRKTEQDHVRHSSMWTKSVLMVGAGGLAILLSLQFLPLDYVYLSPLAPPRGSLFDGLGPAVTFWIFLLAVALVRDFVVSRRDRRVVRSFATVLNRGSLTGDDSVTQTSDVSVLSTNTSGSVNGRMTGVTYREYAGSRVGTALRVEMQCNCPWVLEIGRNNLLARLVAPAMTSIEIADRELAATVVVQGDDEAGIRNWLRDPTVRNRVLSLFRQHNVESVSLGDEGSTLRAEIRVRNQFVTPQFDADAITEALSVLAETLEHR